METETVVETDFEFVDLTKNGEEFWVDARERINCESDEFINRSRMQDEKLKKKKQKISEEEERICEKQALDRLKREKLINQDNEEKKLRRSRLKNRLRNQKKKKNTRDQVKSYLREIPQCCKKILGEGYYLYPVKGDGACGPRCA